jgi:GxxExxY protein
VEKGKKGKGLADELSNRVIGCLIDVHKSLGPGFLEKVYHRAAEVGLRQARIPFETEFEIGVTYLDEEVGSHRLDLFIAEALVVELKTVEMLLPSHYAQLRSYMKAANCETGLLINFSANPLGIRRVDL